MLNHTSKQSGFTIVELLIVIVVIGILAAITIVSYNGITQKAHVAVLQSDLSNARNTLEIAMATNGSYPADLTAAQAAGLKASAGTTYQYSHTTGPEAYCLTGTSNGTSYYIDSSSHTTPTAGSCPVSITDGSFIQTITSTNCPSTRTRAVDARDNHTYWVQKLADGKCWMLTNLSYAGGGTNTYSDVKTLTNGTAGSTTYTTPSYYVPTSGANVTVEPTPPSTSTDGGATNTQYGYYYNWCAAMGGQTGAACSGSLTTPLDATITVCPAGWRIPTGDTPGELSLLNTAINGGSTSSDSGLRTTWLVQYGGLWNGGFFGNGTEGDYWSSTQNSAVDAFDLWERPAGITVNDISNKYQAYAVRCVAM